MWILVLSWALVPAGALADAFTDYDLVETFQLPAGATAFDALADGRLITLAGADVYLETAVGSRRFAWSGAVSGGDFSDFGPAFLRVSPDGTRFAVGNGGGAAFTNFQVGVFDVSGLDGGWFSAGHFDAEWVDNRALALTAGAFPAPSVVTVLDTASPNPADPINTTVITGIGGASGGIAFDASGGLYTGNGFATDGPSGTGAVKHFDHAAWTAALSGGMPVDFETRGTLVVDILSAAALGFDAEGNLHVGGGEFGGQDVDFAALVRASAVTAAILGDGPADTTDPEQVRLLDPDALNDDNFYDIVYNTAAAELYLRDGDTIYTYAVPEPAGLWLLAVGVVMMGRRGVAVRPRRRHASEPRRHRASDRPRPGVTARHNPQRERARPPSSAALRIRTAVVVLPLGVATTWADTPFAVDVIDFAPAPGQFVNDPTFNDATQALGPPTGGGVSAPDNTSVVSLGGFGGSITLAFEHTVTDDALNPFGVDAIVFGNAYWVGSDPESHWAECATIEISTDVNGNGVPDGPPDEPWYLIPGTHIPDPAGQYTAQTWDDDTDDDTYPPADATWIPPGASGVWTTDAHALPLDIFAPPVVHNPATGSDTEGIFGYADYTPTLVLGDLDADGVADDTGVTPDAFYTTPDDPRRVGITAGSGGGDAFDIAWAIDPTTGKPAGATGFDFIRVTSAVTAVSPVFGEKSAEIDAVADVAPDPFGDHDGDGDIDLADIAGLQRCFAPGEPAPPACPRLDRNQDGVIDLLDAAALVDRLIGPTP